LFFPPIGRKRGGSLKLSEKPEAWVEGGGFRDLSPHPELSCYARFITTWLFLLKING